jgi:hypothetical protein
LISILGYSELGFLQDYTWWIKKSNFLGFFFFFALDLDLVLSGFVLDFFSIFGISGFVWGPRT